MTSRREEVLQAVLALVTAALPSADVKRNRDKPAGVGPGGAVIVRDGSPGEPEVDLSPLTHTYDHAIPLEVAAYESATKTAEVVLDEMLTAIGSAVAADRFLGGLCVWLDCEAPDADDLSVAGATSGRWADAVIVATYSTRSPL